MATAVIAKCPECAADVKLAVDVEKGEIVPCSDCGAELEVVERTRLSSGSPPRKRKTGASDVRIGVLCSRVRAEEKLLFESFARRRLEIEKIDDRELVFDLAAQPRRFDVVLERCLHHSRALYSLRILNQWGVPTVNTYEVALTCGDKINTTTSLIAAGVS